MQTKDCPLCGKTFYKIRPGQKQWENRKYCSYACSNISRTFSSDYKSIHIWVGRNFGKPSKCEECGQDGLSRHQINWANVSGKYLRDRDDWIRLCVSCHHIYDDIYVKGWKTRKLTRN